MDLVFPWYCSVCNQRSYKMSICEECKRYLPWCNTTSLCVICALPISTNNSENLICGRCVKERPNYDRLRSVFWYEPPINDLITGYKYLNRWENLQTLTALTVQSFAKVSKEQTVVPVPSYSSRVKQRGFNAVYEFIKQLSKYSNFNYDLNLVSRVRNTETQTGKSRQQRKRNVHNAFRVNKIRLSKSILLIDEVVTTGATVNEISRCLKKSGAEEVLVWTIARTRNNRK